MKPFLTLTASALAIALCLPAAEASAQTARGRPAATAQQGVGVAPLNYTYRQLPNGLKVYSLRDPSTANVSVHVWYDVGSKDDPAGRSGFAHLFEHMLFKSTRNLAPEQFDRLTEDVGGFNNASTADDYTNYYEVVPAHHLERILWAEADRMGSLVVDQATFASERDVVKEELRQRILAQPYGKLFGLYLTQTAFQVHPYGRPGIGSIEDLDAATIDDVRAFHEAFYRPDNAVLVVSGAFDQAQLDAWVDKYFAPIERPERPIPRVTAREPQRNAPRTYTVYEPNTPLPAAVVHYPAPASTHPDMPALMVLDAILSKGESSRLYQSLVYTDQTASEAFSFFSPSKDPGVFALGAILSEGKSVDDGVAGLRAQVARLRDGLATPAELDEAKNQIVTETLQGRETAFGRAFELANSVIMYGDPRRADTLLADIQKVTAQDVRRVARAWLADQRRVEIRYLPEEAKPAGATGDTITTASTIQAKALDVPASEIEIVELAPEAIRQRPPEPGQPVSAQIPAPVERRLSNGLRVIVASDRDLPLISANLRVLSGASSDPSGKGGVAALTGDLVTKGTATRTATQIAQQIESLGASLNSGAGSDSSTVSLQTRSDRAEQAFAIFADVVRNPTFAEDELGRQRQQALDGLSVSLRQPGSIAGYVMSRALYAGAPYGNITTTGSLGRVARADVTGFHQAHWRPDNAVLVIAGDVTPDQAVALAEKHFGSWTAPATPLPAEPDAAGQATAPRTLVVDLPRSGQAAVTLGRRGIARSDERYFPALVANSVLGGGYSARLNQEIRIKRGLSYGARAQLSAMLDEGPITGSTQTKNESAAEVVDLMVAEFARLGDEPIGEAELTARKAVLIGNFGRNIETTSGLAGQLSELALYGLPLTSLQTYVRDVQSVTGDQARQAADALYDPGTATLVVVGDSAQFLDAIRTRRPNAERIGVDALNLDSPTLK